MTTEEALRGLRPREGLEGETLKEGKSLGARGVRATGPTRRQWSNRKSRRPRRRNGRISLLWSCTAGLPPALAMQIRRLAVGRLHYCVYASGVKLPTKSVVTRFATDDQAISPTLV